jgi:soluble lytic murein transglycosylase-like protein
MNIKEAYQKVIIQQEQDLEEGLLKNVAAGAALIGALAGTYHAMKDAPSNEFPTSAVSKITKAPSIIDKDRNSSFSPDQIKSVILDKFSVPEKKLQTIVNAAQKHGKDSFPKAHHLMAIAAIESTFNEKAKSKLRFDPAVGLMQVRPKINNIGRKELTTIDGQIKHGSHILHQLYQKTGSVEAAVKSYNIGLTAHLSGKQKEAANRYFDKFTTELARYHKED